MTTGSNPTTGITQEIVARALSISFDQLPETARDMARLCLLDWLGVAIGGAADEVSRTVADYVEYEGGRPEATVIGLSTKVPASRAALANGTMSHALDYDDVNRTMNGHPTAPVLPAAFALAETSRSSGHHFMTAFVAGYETACRVGALVFPDHYRRGFHATATIGSFGAAMASARCLDLDQERAAMAMGIAGTEAAGLKSMFGTACKPFHAGRAAENGVVAARLAARGFTSRGDVLECRDGFASTHSSVFNPEAALAEPSAGFHILNNLFKYHASCYRTHASIEAAAQLRERHDFRPEDIAEVTIQIAEEADRICNIAEPRTGLEVKFSLRATAAIALLGLDTAAIDTYSDKIAVAPDVVALRDKVRVDLQPGMVANHSIVDVKLRDRRELSASCNVGIPETNLTLLRQRLESKFRQLVTPVLGSEAMLKLLDLTQRIEMLDDIRELAKLCAPFGK